MEVLSLSVTIVLLLEEPTTSLSMAQLLAQLSVLMESMLTQLTSHANFAVPNVSPVSHLQIIVSLVDSLNMEWISSRVEPNVLSLVLQVSGEIQALTLVMHALLVV